MNSRSRRNIPRSSSTQDLGSLETKTSPKTLTRSSSSIHISLDSDFTKKNFNYKYSIFSVVEAKPYKQTNKVTPSLLLSDEPFSYYMPYLNSIKTNYETLLKMRKGSYDSIKNELNKTNEEEERNIKDIVPDLFFREDFDITNSTTFYKIYEDDNDEQNLKTIENLQNYLSIIEKELSDKLNKRTDSFFRAFEDLQNLHSALKQSFSRTEDFKTLLNKVDENIVNENLSVIKKQIRLRNLKDVQNRLKLIVNIKKIIPQIKDLISNDQIFQAIEYIEQSKEIISSQLSGIKVASDFKTQLEELNGEIDHKLISQFVIHACGKIEESRNKIIPLIKQLVNMKFSKLSKALDYYLEIQERDISELFIKCWKDEMNGIEPNNEERIIQFINGTHKGKGRDELDENFITSLDSSVFIERFEFLTFNLFKKIRNAKNLYNAIEDVFSSINNTQEESSSSLSVDDEKSESEKSKNEQMQLRMKLLIDLNDLLNSLTDIINIKISKIFKFREDQHKRLTPEKFITLHSILFQFIKDCETLTQRESYLRSTLSSFKKLYLDSNHMNKIAKLSLILENENWLRAEIASEFSSILKCLMDPNLPLQFTIDEKAENMKDIYFEGERYLLVNSGLLFTKMVYDYLLILEEIPEIHSDIILKISDLFNTFHTKTYSLILERKAVKISTLKSISATHMALTWQSLTLMISMIPKIRERISNLKVDSEIDFTELDNVLKEYILHREEVISKIVTLMSDRVDSLFKNYKVEESSSEPSKPFVQLAEKTKVLHKILKATIHQQHFNIIFKQIILLYNNKLTNIFSNITIKSPKEKQKILQDVYYFLGKLRELEGIDDPTDEVAEYVHAHVK